MEAMSRKMGLSETQGKSNRFSPLTERESASGLGGRVVSDHAETDKGAGHVGQAAHASGWFKGTYPVEGGWFSNSFCA